MTQHVSGLEYIIRSKILYLFSLLFIIESYKYCIRPPRSILLSVIWYDSGVHRLIVSLSAFQLFIIF